MHYDDPCFVPHSLDNELSNSDRHLDVKTHLQLRRQDSELSHDCPCHHEPKPKKSIGGLTSTTVNGTEASYKTALTHFGSKETIEPRSKIESSRRQIVAQLASPTPQEFPTLPEYSAQEHEQPYVVYGQTHVYQHQDLSNQYEANASIRRPPSHEELLLAASSGIYDSIQPRQSICNKIHRAYKPTYDPEDFEKQHPLFCGGRLKKWQFITLHILVIVLLLCAIIIPLAYFVLVPKYIQYRIDNLDAGTIKLDHVTVKEFNPQGLAFHVKATLPPLMSFLPIKAGFGPCAFTLYDQDNQPLAAVQVPYIDFYLHQDLELDFSGKVDLASMNEDAVKEHIQGFSSAKGLENVQIDGRTATPLYAIGIKWYSGLPLHRLIELGNVKSDLLGLMAMIPPFMQSSSLNQETRSHFPDSDIITLLPNSTLPIIAMTDLDVTLNDLGMTINTIMHFENPVKVIIEDLENVELGLRLDDATLVRVLLHRLDLKLGYQKMELSIDIFFDHSLISHQQVQEAFKKASQDVINNRWDQVRLGISGPVSLQQVDIISGITNALLVTLPVKEMVDSVATSDLKSLLSVDGVKDVLAKSSLDISVKSESIDVISNVLLPVFLAIPRRFSFPYMTEVFVGRGAVNALGIQVSPVLVTRDDSSIKVDTGVKVLPINTIEAASALASSINPLLAASPSASSIDVLRFGFTDHNGYRFKWCDALFGSNGITVPLPNIICKTCILSLLTSNGTSLPIGLKEMDIAQLEMEPGFAAQGTVDLKLPGWLPAIHLDLGYANLDVTVEQHPIARTVLPSGIKYDMFTSLTHLEVNFILQRQIAPQVQALLDAFMHEGSASAGMTGLSFGQNSHDRWITFSQISFEIAVADVKPLILDAGKSLLNQVVTPGLLTMNGVDLDVKSASIVNIGAETLLANPTPISLSLGSIGLEASLDGEHLSGLGVSSIEIQKGKVPFNVAVGLQINKGTDMLASKVAALVNQVLYQTNDNDFTFALSKLILYPKQNPNGPGKIDMLSSLVIELNTRQIFFLLTEVGSILSIVDVTPLLPSQEALNQIQPSLRSVELVASPQASLLAGISAAYTNPLPISLKLSYAAAGVTLESLELELVNAKLLGLQLVKGRGIADIHSSLSFPQNDQSMPDKVAALVKNFAKGHIQPPLGVKDIFFGSSPDDVNILLSKFKLDLSFLTQHIERYGPEAIQFCFDYAFGLLEQYTMGDTFHMTATSDGGLALQLAPNLMVDIGEAKVEVQPSKRILCELEAAVQLPFHARIYLPELSMFIGLDETPFLGTRITGLDLQSQGTSKMRLGTHLEFHDDENVQNAIALLAQGLLKRDGTPSVLNIQNVVLGYSADDTLSTFSKLQIPLPIDPLIKITSNLMAKGLSSLDMPSLIKSLGISLGSVRAQTLPGKALQTGLGLAFQNHFRITIQGIGFMTASVGIDDVPFTTMHAAGFNLAPSNNIMEFSAKLNFPSSDSIQDKIARLVDKIVSHDFKDVTERALISTIRFGFSETDTIDFLNKVAVNIPIGFFINDKVVTLLAAILQNSLNWDVKDIDPKSLIERVTLEKLNFDASPMEGFLLEANAAMNKVPIIMDVDIGYYHGSALLNDERLADFAANSALRVSTVNSSSSVGLGTTLSLDDSEPLQESTSKIVSNLLDDQELSDKVGVTNLMFGTSPSDTIDTFSKVDLKLPINPAIKPIKSLILSVINDVIDGKSPYGISIKQMDVDIVERNVFDADTTIELIGLPKVMTVNIPFAAVGVRMDERRLCSTELNIIIKDGVVTCQTRLPFEDDKENGNKLLQFVRNVLWHQTNILPYSMGAMEILFGASRERVNKLAAKVSFPLPFGPVLAMIKKYVDTNRPTELTNIPTVVNDKGIQATVYAKELPIPLNFKAPIFNASILYQVKGVGPVYHVAWVDFDHLKITPGHPISMECLISPDFAEDGIIDPLKESLLFLLGGGDYAQNARLGYMTLRGSNGAAFDIMDTSYMQAPDLYFYKPISLDIKPSNPIRQDGLELVPLKFVVTFPNTGPLHLDIGILKISVTNGDRDLVNIVAPGAIVIKNVLEGGNLPTVTNPENGDLRVILPWSDFNPIKFFKHLLEFLNPKKYGLAIDLVRPNQGPLEWIRKAVKGVLDMEEVKAFIPVLFSLIGRIHWKIFGKQITHRKAALTEANKKALATNNVTLEKRLPIGNETTTLSTSARNLTTSLDPGPEFEGIDDFLIASDHILRSYNSSSFLNIILPSDDDPFF